MSQMKKPRSIPGRPGGCYHCQGGTQDCICPASSAFRAEVNVAKTDQVGALLDERHKTHGSFATNAAAGQTLRNFFRKSKGWELATDRQREALEYIAGKLSRILSGQPGHADHWDDIAGYAKLAANPDLQR